MNEHVSIETARALAEAGLRRTEWQVGDWVALKGHRQPFLVLAVGETYLQLAGLGAIMTRRALWLPTAGQLLDLLAMRGWTAADYDYQFKRWGVVNGETLMRENRGNSADLAEACGQALLAALKAKGEGK